MSNSQAWEFTHDLQCNRVAELFLGKTLENQVKEIAFDGEGIFF